MAYMDATWWRREFETYAGLYSQAERDRDEARQAALEIFSLAELSDEQMEMLWSKYPWLRPSETILPPYEG